MVAGTPTFDQKYGSLVAWWGERERERRQLAIGALKYGHFLGAPQAIWTMGGVDNKKSALFSRTMVTPKYFDEFFPLGRPIWLRIAHFDLKMQAYLLFRTLGQGPTIVIFVILADHTELFGILVVQIGPTYVILAVDSEKRT